MRIALLGYGKMGKAIEEIAIGKGHEIVLKIDENNTGDFTKENISKADVAIEFTNPHSAYDNVRKSLEFGIPVVSGSTGWTDRLSEIIKYCKEKNGAFLYSSNYSIGVWDWFQYHQSISG